jgi:hypothetical protein
MVPGPADVTFSSEGVVIAAVVVLRRHWAGVDRDATDAPSGGAGARALPARIVPTRPSADIRMPMPDCLIAPGPGRSPTPSQVAAS